MLTERRVTLAGVGEAELEEKRSLFIGYAAPVSSEEEARKIVEAKKKEYSDATHNVWAYWIDGGAHARYSDDGEPQGTAGMPTLNVLKMSGATDLCVVVTRYFGGTLLGAGGLVRAYSAAAKLALDAAGFAVMEEHVILEIRCSYGDFQKLSVQLSAMGAIVDDTAFGEDVSLVVAISTAGVQQVLRTVQDVTSGRGSVRELRREERPAATGE